MEISTRLKHTNSLIDLTPLVDVVLLMLIFFLITSDILPLKSLNIHTPTLNTNSAPLTAQLMLALDAEGVIYLGAKKNIVDLATLKEELQKEIFRIKSRVPGADPTLVLSVDKNVDYGSFLKLFAIAQSTSPKIRLHYLAEGEEP
ncbi:MAG: biopolymer transporter ExbD [Chlamydiia bacterium]|nr:biopolymer transporter ExbD [Chlamydiia bacterium]